jgi:uncharacterized protein (TIGR01777 family)
MTTPVLDGRESFTRMVIAISGSRGLIGSALVRALEARGHEVRRIIRGEPSSPTDISWDTGRGTFDVSRLAGVNAVINLAGESLDQRWTTAARREIRESRVAGTSALARALASMDPKPRVLLSGSAIGVYGSRGDEILDERSTTGKDFLAEVCTAWEAAATPAADAGIRVVFLRSGIVLSRDGGALARMLTPFRLGIGGRLGSGRQWMSWISIEDYPRVVGFLLATEAIAGPVNVASPIPVVNAEFTRTLGRIMGRPSLFPVPAVALKVVLGEMAQDTVLASQRVVPRRLLEANFDFQHPTLESALRAALAHPEPAAAR